MKLQLSTDVTVRPEHRQCALCGQMLAHQAVIGRGAHLVYQASVDLQGRVWLPVKHGGCDLPPKSTARFWDNDLKREAWKAEERHRRIQARGELH